MYKVIQVKSKLRHTGIWSAAVGAFRRQCYRPSVFFRHLSLIGLLFPQGKMRHAFRKCYYFNLFAFLKITCVSRWVSVLEENICFRTFNFSRKSFVVHSVNCCGTRYWRTNNSKWHQSRITNMWIQLIKYRDCFLRWMAAGDVTRMNERSAVCTRNTAALSISREICRGPKTHQTSCNMAAYDSETKKCRKTECRMWGSVFNLYSGSPEFDSRDWDRVFWLTFSWFCLFHPRMSRPLSSLFSQIHYSWSVDV